MRSSRRISTLIIAILLILRGGECIPLLFADEQTRECCFKGECGRWQKSACCEAGSSDAVQYFQAEEKFSVPALAEAHFTTAAAGWFTSWTVEPAFIDTSPPAPPGVTNTLSIPLLI